MPSQKPNNPIMSDAEKGLPETSDEPVNLKFNMNVANRDPNGINEHLKVSCTDFYHISSFFIAKL